MLGLSVVLVHCFGVRCFVVSRFFYKFKAQSLNRRAIGYLRSDCKNGPPYILGHGTKCANCAISYYLRSGSIALTRLFPRQGHFLLLLYRMTDMCISSLHWLHPLCNVDLSPMFYIFREQSFMERPCSKHRTHLV